MHKISRIISEFFIFEKTTFMVMANKYSKLFFLILICYLLKASIVFGREVINVPLSTVEVEIDGYLSDLEYSDALKIEFPSPIKVFLEQLQKTITLFH